MGKNVEVELGMGILGWDRMGPSRGGGAAHQVLVALRGVRVVGGGWIVSHSACHPHGPALPCHPLTHKRWLECALLQNGTMGLLYTLLHSLLHGLTRNLTRPVTWPET